MVDGIADHPAAVRVVPRNVMRWQFGHMGGVRLADPEGNTELAIVFCGISIGLLVAVAGPPLFDVRGLHEVAAGTEVVNARVRGPGQTSAANWRTED